MRSLFSGNSDLLAIALIVAVAGFASVVRLEDRVTHSTEFRNITRTRQACVERGRKTIERLHNRREQILNKIVFIR